MPVRLHRRTACGSAGRGAIAYRHHTPGGNRHDKATGCPIIDRCLAGAVHRGAARGLRHHLGRQCGLHLDAGHFDQLRRLPAQRRRRAARLVSLVVRCLDRTRRTQPHAVPVAHAPGHHGAGAGTAARLCAAHGVCAGRALQPADLEYGGWLWRTLHDRRLEHGRQPAVRTDLRGADHDQPPHRHQSLQPGLLHRAQMAGLELGRRVARAAPERRTTCRLVGTDRHPAGRDCSGVLSRRRPAQQPERAGADAGRRGCGGLAAAAGLQGAGQAALRRHAAGAAGRPDRDAEHRCDRQGGGDRQWRDLPGLALLRHRAGQDHPRQTGSDRQGGIDQQGDGAPLDRLPLGVHAAQPELRRHHAGRADRVRVRGTGTRCVRLPLRHATGAAAHGERHVRGHHRRSGRRSQTRGRQGVRAGAGRVVHPADRGHADGSGLRQDAAHPARHRRLQRHRLPVPGPSPDGAPERARAPLHGQRRPQPVERLPRDRRDLRQGLPRR